MENTINKELTDIINKTSDIISKNNLPEQDLRLINYYFNCIYGLMLAFCDETTAVVKKERTKIKTKRKYTKKKVYKTEEVMQVVDNKEDNKEN